MFLRPSEGRITSPFDPARKNPVHGKVQPHTGVDFGRDGSPVVIAAAEGIVTRAHVMGGYGNCVTIKHTINGKSYETLYAHLKSINVKINQKVKAGDRVGLRGSTGNSTGEHLHFSIFSPYYKEGLEFALDPLHYIVDKDIKNIQVLLNKNGYKLVVDGLRGKETDKAIRDFQKRNSLVVDGIVGEQTLKTLNIKSSTIVQTSTPLSTQKSSNDVLTFSSPTLQKETEFSINSKARRKIIVETAISGGASPIWKTKLDNKTITDDDILALAMKYVIAKNK